LGQPLSGGVVDGQGETVLFRQKVLAASHVKAIGVTRLLYLQEGAGHGQQEPMMKTAAEGSGQAPQLAEVHDPPFRR